MDDELLLPSLEDTLLGARIIFVREWQCDGEEWTALTLDNGFELHFAGSAIIVHPLPN